MVPVGTIVLCAKTRPTANAVKLKWRFYRGGVPDASDQAFFRVAFAPQTDPENGAAGEIRTLDLPLTKGVLYP